MNLPERFANDTIETLVDAEQMVLGVGWDDRQASQQEYGSNENRDDGIFPWHAKASPAE